MGEPGVQERISAREAEVLAAVGEHLNNAEIAARLFISVRTVESHVSALLRKLGAADRRELAVRASVAPAAAVHLPTPLSSFVGRLAERAELAAAVIAHRLVTATGPGGVGKTRLAVAVAGDVADRFPGGVWFVDLVPVADPMSIIAGVASAIGAGEQQGRSVEESVLARLAGRTSLLVLDNCEHVVDGVVEVVERLLSRSPGLRVLATSRVRLQLPFETVHPVAGLALPGPEAAGDAVRLFMERSGAGPLSDDHARVGRICRALDGMPLAIELAAARLPAVGLDGLEAGLDDRLPLLAGPRGDRHRSLRTALDWSHDLLYGSAQVVLRRVWVFSGPFRADDAATVAAGAPLASREIGPSLAALADHHLVEPVAGADGTRYRMLETVRQYGAELAEAVGEHDRCRESHLRWCLDAGTVLLRADGAGPVDARLAPELRGAAAWAASHPDRRSDAHDVLVVLAALAHRAGRPGEAQRCSESAAAHAPTSVLKAAALHRAAGSAAARMGGDDAVRLHRSAAAAALAAGRRAAAAADLARAAELAHRASGCMVEQPSAATVADLLEQARRHAGGDPAAEARIAVAEAFGLPEWDPAAARAGQRALRLAARSADPLIESAALDRITTVQLHRGEFRSALAGAARRTALLAPLPVDADMGFERPDAHVMATECAVAAGDLDQARHFARIVRDEALHLDDDHLAVARLVVVTALAGDWDETIADAPRFRAGWERAGRPVLGDVRRSAQAIAAVFGLRGDDDGRAEWLAITAALTPPDRASGDVVAAEFFDGLLHLHRGDPDTALAVLGTPLEQCRGWLAGIWRPWHAALRAEAAVLAGRTDAAEQVGSAAAAAGDNPVATALVRRAAALAGGDRDGVRATAADLAAAGCRYQGARSLVLAGDPAGHTAMAQLVGTDH